MANDEELGIVLKFLSYIKEHHKLPQAHAKPLSILQYYATSTGLSTNDIDGIFHVIQNGKSSVSSLLALIKCLIPKHGLDGKRAKLFISWYLGSIHTLRPSITILFAQWLIGMLQYQLIDRKFYHIFYNVFFSVMLKHERLGRYIAHIVFLLAKPEDVTRRDVSRLFHFQNQYEKNQKHILVLLSLFKSYKPELVPERIRSVNAASAWIPIPEVLRVPLENARLRLRSKADKDGIGSEFLLSSVEYGQIEFTAFEEMGIKIQELENSHLGDESSGDALLHNTKFYHLLTFADFRHQRIFCYNLYHRLKRAFMSENEFSVEQIKRLCKMTTDFSRYMQQGIPAVNSFLDDYLYFNTGEYQSELLNLLQWMTSVPIQDLQQKTLVYIKNMFYESTISMKCEIIRTLKMLIINRFVNQGFNDDSDEARPAPFLGLHPVDQLEYSIPILSKICKDLIVSGLNIHSFHILFLSEALSFYEEIFTLEDVGALSSFTIAPPAVVYGSFVAKHCIFLSRICKLLFRYHERCVQLKSHSIRNKFHKNIKIVAIYIKDISRALWYNEPFKKRSQARFLKNIPDRVLIELEQCNLDHFLNITNHFAILPFRYILNKTGLSINTNEEALCVALYYYPNVKKFLDISKKYQ